jgi:hypothetical protein
MLLLLAIPVMWGQRRSGERRPLVAATGLAVLGLAVATLVSFAIFGTTERYEVDFVTFLLIPAFLVWAMLLARARPGTAVRRIWAIVGVVLTLMGAGVGTAISFTGYENRLYGLHPAIFSALEDVTGPFATVATMIGGNPQIARIDDGPLPVTTASGTIGFSEDHANAVLGNVPMTLTVLSPDDRRTSLFATLTPGPGVPSSEPAVVFIVSSDGRTAITRLTGSRIRLPVSLHWGLNRIHLTMVGPSNAAPQVVLNDIAFGS